MSSQEHTETRRILLAVTGLSPQIVTETLYALAVGPGRPQPWVPHEIHLITTARGADNARLQLLHPETGWFYRLCRDYQLPAIQFAESNIHLIERPDGTALDDIRDDEDNRLAADTIARWVQRLTADPTSEIHASIAGGRKTMGFFLGYAMSLFGRPQDRLSHVLVSSPYESSVEFFYPTPYSHVIRRPNAPNEVLDAAQARVWLGDIPFVRLRSELDEETCRRTDAAFYEAVQQIQESLTPTRLVIIPAERSVLVGRQRVKLRPAELAMLIWVIERQQQGRPVRRHRLLSDVPEDESQQSDESKQDAAEYLAIYQRLLPDPEETDTPTHNRLKHGLLQDFFDERLSRLKRAFAMTLGASRAAPYLIKPQGQRGRCSYGLGLPLEQIEIIDTHRSA